MMLLKLYLSAWLLKQGFDWYTASVNNTMR